MSLLIFITYLTEPAVPILQLENPEKNKTTTWYYKKTKKWSQDGIQENWTMANSFPITSRWKWQAFHIEEIKILFHIAFIMTKWKNTAIFILGRLLISINIKAENTGKQCKRSAMFVMGSSSGLTSFLIITNSHGSWPTAPKSGHTLVTTSLMEHCNNARYKSIRLHNDFCLNMALLRGEKDGATLKILIVKSVNSSKNAAPNQSMRFLSIHSWSR